MTRITAFVIGILVGCSAAYANVNVSINNQRFTYQQPAYIANVLAPVAEQAYWYWPASRFFNLGSDEWVAELADVKQRLQHIVEYSGSLSDRGIALQSITRQLESWRLADFVPMVVDYDQARLFPTRHPQLMNGNYYIALTTRPEHVNVFGAVQHEQYVALKPDSSVSEYLQQVTLLDSADNDYVYVIAPSGAIEKLGIAYWNVESYAIMPGSMIYVPLKPSLIHPSIEKFNERIAQLAINRMPQ